MDETTRAHVALDWFGPLDLALFDQLEEVLVRYYKGLYHLTETENMVKNLAGLDHTGWTEFKTQALHAARN